MRFPSIRIFMRAVGLHSFYTALSCSRKSVEEPKILLSSQLRNVLLQSAIHVIPLIGTVAMAWFNFSNTYLGSELPGRSGMDDQKMVMLQIVAKLYEMTVVASLASIIFHLVRRELIFGNGVPLGILACGMSFSQLSYLWSREYWAAVIVARGKHTIFIVAFLAVSTIMSALVGPLTAGLIIPDNNWHSAGGSTFWVTGSDETLFPLQLGERPDCVDDELRIDCPAGGYYSVFNYAQTISTFLDPSNGFTVVDPMAHRHFHTGEKRTRSCPTTVYGPHYTLAHTISSVAMIYRNAVKDVESVRSYKYYLREATRWTFDSKAAVVQVQCYPQQLSRSKDPLLFQNIYIPANKTLVNPGEIKISEPQDVGITQSSVFAAAEKQFDVSQKFIQWVQLPGSFDHASIGVYVSQGPSSSVASAAAKDLVLNGTACTIDARWAPAEYLQEYSIGIQGGNAVSLKNRPCTAPCDCQSPEWPQISITTQWGERLNPIIKTDKLTGRNWTAFDSLLEPTNLYHNVDDIELALAAFVSDGISRSGATNGDPNWVKDDSAQEFVRGGAAFVPTIPADSTSEFKAAARLKGYGFNAETVTTKASLGMVLLYAVIVVVYFTYSLQCGWSSESWDSIPEIVTLALNSRHSSGAMANTCAGIESFGTLKKRAFVAETTPGHLELLFEEDDKEGGTIQRAALGHLYGGFEVGTQFPPAVPAVDKHY